MQYMQHIWTHTRNHTPWLQFVLSSSPTFAFSCMLPRAALFSELGQHKAREYYGMQVIFTAKKQYRTVGIFCTINSWIRPLWFSISYYTLGLRRVWKWMVWWLLGRNGIYSTFFDITFFQPGFFPFCINHQISQSKNASSLP